MMKIEYTPNPADTSDVKLPEELLPLIEEMARHSNIATTLNLYVHPNMEQKKKCIDKMLRSL